MFLPIYDLNKKKYIRYQYVTLALILVNIAVWGFGTIDPANETTVQNASFFTFGFIPALASGQASIPVEYDFLPHWSRLFTYSFVHSDFMHLGGNMLFLWVFGDNVEDAMGHLRFLVFYIACAVCGALAYMLAYPDMQSPLIGASAAASGVVVVYMMLHPRVKVWVLLLARIPLRISAIWILGGWIVFQLYSLLIDTDGNTAWIAHLGGIVAGAVLVCLLKRHDVALFDFEVPETPPEALANVNQTGSRQVTDYNKPETVHSSPPPSQAPVQDWERKD